MSRYDPSPNEKPPVLFEWRKIQKCVDDSFPIQPCPEWFQNKFGMYRWYMIRAAYDDGIIDEDYVTELSVDWRDTSEYFMLEGIDSDDQSVIDIFVKAAKRGNDVYKAKVSRKFAFLDRLPPIHFFNEDWGHKYTSMLFVTYTVDTKKINLRDAWHAIGREYNETETKLRQHFGHFVKLRVWEAHESGYPHIHVVYFFNKQSFEVFETFEEREGFEPKRVWRIANKHNQFFKKAWSLGSNVDVRGVSDTHGAFSEVKKYVTKTIWSKKADKTNALLTLFRKQSYGISTCNPYEQKIPDDIKQLDPISRHYALNTYIAATANFWASKDFIGSVWGVDQYLKFYWDLTLRNETLAEPGLSALVKETMSNYNIEFPEIVKWVFVGFVAGDDLERFFPKCTEKWTIGVKDPPSDLWCYVNIPEVY